MTRHERLASLHREVTLRMQKGDFPAADAVCRRLNAEYPEFAPGWFIASRIAAALGTRARALEAIENALEREPARPAFLVQRAQCLLALGRRGGALRVLDTLEQGSGLDAAAWDAIGTLRSQAGDFRRAVAAYDRALALAPNDPHFFYNRAAVRRFLGELDEAEADYDRVIDLAPSDYEAYLNRSQLRVQSPERNHVAELEALLGRSIPDWRAQVQLRFALAKEHEDLGAYAVSFAHLRGGAKLRREHLQYDVATDIATVDWITDAFPAPSLGAVPRPPTEAPLFIVGLPRSGTTLVERILASHPALSSAGEPDCFALAITDAVRARNGAAKVTRRELIGLSATLDFAALGRDYVSRIRSAFDVGERFIDKMPLNYLYCGLIRRALPHARIIHVRRHPMAVGYAMYKTLFKDGYPFSYDLSEIGQYYVAYHRLMAHWRSTVPEAIHEIQYEDLVLNQRGEIDKLLAFCGLPWHPACAAFHENPAPSTTASASQVRRPIYRSSLDQWRKYEVDLTELSRALAAGGITLP